MHSKCQLGIYYARLLLCYAFLLYIVVRANISLGIFCSCWVKKNNFFFLQNVQFTLSNNAAKRTLFGGREWNHYELCIAYIRNKVKVMLMVHAAAFFLKSRFFLGTVWNKLRDFVFISECILLIVLIRIKDYLHMKKHIGAGNIIENVWSERSYPKVSKAQRFFFRCSVTETLSLIIITLKPFYRFESDGNIEHHQRFFCVMRLTFVGVVT